jgi:CRISPR-associated endoribonuclease Cas6
MRIHLELTPNTSLVPFNYQTSLVGAFHKWLGENELHGSLALHSFSWLDGSKAIKGGLNFRNGASWFISAYDEAVVKTIVKGIMDDSNLNFGMQVNGIRMEPTPKLTHVQRFLLASPVLVKRPEEGKVHDTYYTFKDEAADAMMTETLQNKLKKANMDGLDVSVHFDRGYNNPKTKLIDYRGIKIRASSCPVILKGDPEAIGFAWNVGIGNSTGIGFGGVR